MLCSKERKKLILVVRENPYNLIHLKNMTLLTEAGAIISPATPSFYSLPQTIDELADTVVNRVLDLAGFENNGFKWQEEKRIVRLINKETLHKTSPLSFTVEELKQEIAEAQKETVSYTQDEVKAMSWKK